MICSFKGGVCGLCGRVVRLKAKSVMSLLQRVRQNGRRGPFGSVTDSSSFTRVCLFFSCSLRRGFLSLRRVGDELGSVLRLFSSRASGKGLCVGCPVVRSVQCAGRLPSEGCCRCAIGYTRYRSFGQLSYRFDRCSGLSCVLVSHRQAPGVYLGTGSY